MVPRCPVPAREANVLARSRGAASALAALLVSVSAAGGAVPAEEPGSAKVAIPADYRGAGTPLESEDTASAVRIAADHFQAKEWARGFAAIDRTLDALASGARRKGPAKPRPPREEPRAPVEVGLADDVAPEAEDEGEFEEEPDILPEEEVVTLDGILYEPVPAAVRRWAARLPREAKDVARSAYEAAASQALARAFDLARTGAPRDRILSALRRVGERYPWSPSAVEAWWAYADRALAAGRPADSAFAYRAILDLAPDSKTRAAALAHLAAAELLAGSARAGREALETIAREFPAAAVAVRGEPVPGAGLPSHPFFRSLVDRAERAAPPVSRDPRSEAFAWTSEAGSFDGAGFDCPPEALPETGSRAAWILPLLEGVEEDPEESARRGGEPARGAVLGERVFVRRGSEVLAVSARSGKLLWRAGSPDAPPGDAPAVAAASSACLSLCVPPGPERPLVLAIEPPVVGVVAKASGVAYRPNELVAYDALSGKLRWKAAATAPGATRRRELALISAPACAAGRIAALAVQGESAYLAAFSTNGKLEWTRRLYTFSPGQNVRYGGTGGLRGDVFAEGDLFVATAGHGLAAGVSASGELLWVSRYRSSSDEGYAGVRNDPGGGALAGGAFVAAPPDSPSITAFRVREGKILWERPRGGHGPPERIVAADRTRVFVAAGSIRALDAASGKVLWESPSLGGAPRTGVLAGGRLAVPAGGTLFLLDAETGSVASKLRILDPRIPASEPIEVFLARDRWIGATPARLFALEPQSAAWRALEGEGARDPFVRVRLLEAEGRHDEAIARLEEMHRTFRSPAARAQVREHLVEATKMAAGASEDPGYVSRLLALDPPAVEDRAELVGLRVLEAELLEVRAQGGDEEARTRFAAVCLELASAPADATVRTRDGIEVSARGYAADSLRRLARAGRPAGDDEGETKARERLRKSLGGGAGTGTDAEAIAAAPQALLAEIVLRAPHLRVARDACRELARRASETGAGEAAADLAAIAERDLARDPAEADPGVQAAVAREAPSPAFRDLLARSGGRPLEKRFWCEEEETLIESAPVSEPLPGVLTIAKGKLRLRGSKGQVVAERELPRYLDVAEIAASAGDGGPEESAVGAFDGKRLVIFSSGGIYAFDLDGRSAERPLGALRLRWLSEAEPPVASSASPLRGGVLFVRGAFRSGGEAGFLARTRFDPEGRPIVVLPDGTFFSLDPATGRFRWRLSAEGAVADPTFYGPWVSAVSAGRSELRIFRNPERPRPRGPSRFRDPPESVPLPEGGAAGAALVAGGLAAVFATPSGPVVVETASGRPLWKGTGLGLGFLFARGGELWFAAGGALSVRSLWSGREEGKAELPGKGSALEVLAPEPLLSAGAIATVVAGGPRSYPTGRQIRRAGSWTWIQPTDGLRAVAIGPGPKALSDATLVRGKAVYLGSPYVAEDGQRLFASVAETEPGKWYTRCVVFDPKASAVRDLVSVEARSEARAGRFVAAIVEGGLALATEDGFGLFAIPEGPREENPR